MDLFVFFAGFGGGAVRGLMGFLKHQHSYKEVRFDLPQFLFTVVVSGTVGIIVAFVVQELQLPLLGTTTLTPAIALIVGYSGSDFIESLHKVIVKRLLP